MNRFAWALVTVVTLSCAVRAADPTPDTLETVKKNLADKKAVLVDVREADEWKDGHLKGAKHLALSDLKKGVPADDLKKLLPAGQIAYLHCGAGRRALAAADILKKEGFDVRPLKDGYKELVKNGFPEEK